MPVTDYIEDLEGLLDFAVNSLKNYTGWTVLKYPGTDPKSLFDFLPAAELPSAIVAFHSEKYGNDPRLTARLDVIVASEWYSEDSQISARQLLRKAVELLDRKTTGHALFEAKEAKSLDLGQGVAAFNVSFSVKDH